MKRGQFRYTIPMSLLCPPAGSFSGSMLQAGVLDMMRYDAARIVDWDHDRENGVLTLQSEVFTLARWQSFGITPRLISDMA